MNIILLTTDGTRIIFRDQKDSLMEDVALSVVSGKGFTLQDEKHGLIAYAPGSVSRVNFYNGGKKDEE